MDPDLAELDAYLEETSADGYLIDADSEESNQYYLSGFDAPDPFVTLYKGNVHLLFSRSLEYGRAKREARAQTVERGSDYSYPEYAREYGPTEARIRTIADFLSAHNVESVATPPRFPLQTADALREHGIDVVVDEEETLTGVRALKTNEEIEHVRAAQRANEAAMDSAEALIAGADVNDEGQLVADGAVLTSERVKEEIEVTLLRHGCALDETIVACGRDAADPHDRGSGPLEANEPIIIDIFPRSKSSRYHADMTRTFCHGEPSDRLEQWFELTDEAREAALEAVEPGATGDDVHAAASGVYEDAGLPTLRDDPGTETGFIHSTGHGVGLDVHEQPSVSPRAGELEPGHIITIEPGLYDPTVGGVRIEDLVVVTEEGHENLTDYPVHLRVGN